ncbi:hypothetical protein PEX1_048390 [Penicillium expansum]|uniref:Uncharacterized protein n=1 Tax=Penicillium expansum TaxID=27334 RepID=A0A0A2ID70_PENEN|nr:hypothetical protein PEX2_089590 [Penicillium expansum]KGO40361.1 hypothetical protein PEXP_031760 [Penicillium expansum]KGO54662.1 hypothetical protein PEX1_048390 [Penicillium expansum]KGO54974.1 hypothetical protein PEX2_089590 [Penicillium expansum]
MENREIEGKRCRRLKGFSRCGSVSDKLKNGFTPLEDCVNHKTRKIERKSRPQSYRSREKKGERERR